MDRIDRLTLSRRARHDIEMILQSTEESWGAEQSARYSAAIDAVLSRIATYPEIGVVRPATGDVRSFPVERHLMLY